MAGSRSTWEKMTEAVKEALTTKSVPYDKKDEKRSTIEQVDARARKQAIDDAVDGK